MKIAHVIYSFNIGGAETMLIDIANNQLNQGHDVSLIIVNDSYTKSVIEKLDQGIKVSFINRPEGSRNLYYVFKLNFELWKRHYDVIHLHNASTPALVFKYPPGRVLCSTVHALGISPKCPGRVDRFIAISEAVASDLKNRCRINAHVVANGINCDDIEVRDSRQFHRPFRIVEVARLYHDKKGQDILIDALRILIDNGFDATVDFIGSGPSEEYLKNLCSERGLDDKINFLGLRDRNYIYSHLCEYDLMCHPARFEGFGLTVAEGMAARLPVLVSDKGGPAELIEHGRYGYTFVHEDASNCAKMIMHIADNYIEALEKLDEAQEHVKRDYSVARMCREYETVYKSL